MQIPDLRQLIQPTRLWRTGAHTPRRATWNELFFDLIFVAAVSEVGKPLSAGYTLDGVLRYCFLFVLIWWAWSGHTLFTTRFQSDDLAQKLFTLVQGFIAAVMAANARDALDSRSSAGFGAAYAGMRLVLVFQYLRARRIPETRTLTTRFALGFGIAALIWIGSALTEAPQRYWLWALALSVDFATPWIAERHGMHVPPHAEHFPERYGLFTIILLGEFIAEVMRGISSQEYWSLPAASTAFGGMAFVFFLRWLYFDGAGGASERHVHTPEQARRFKVWNYAHLPLFLGLGVAGVGMKHLIALQEGRQLHPIEALIFGASVTVAMLALATIGFVSKRAEPVRESSLPSHQAPHYAGQ
ncbi:MAG: low temperature requirement protein A [Bryobacterales bacterium]|nr:low temperature requirement protein A [Bryobacterales bacterium]